MNSQTPEEPMAVSGQPSPTPKVKRVTIRVTGLRGGTQEQPCVDCGKAVRVAAHIDGDRAAMPEVLCAGCAPFRRLAEDLASLTGQSREAMHRLLSALAKPAPVIDTTAARARIAHMAIGGAYPACPTGRTSMAIERSNDWRSVLLNGDPVEVTIRGERYAMRAISDPQSPDLPYEFRAGRVAYPDTLRIED